LIEIGLADDDRPGLLEPIDDKGGAFGITGECRTGGAGRQARDVDIVLDGERNKAGSSCAAMRA
jgi:hypothetical protein